MRLSVLNHSGPAEDPVVGPCRFAPTNRRLCVSASVIALVALAAAAAPQAITARPHRTKTRAVSTTQPPLQRLIGQLLVGSFTGRVVPQSLLARIKAGQLGSVILFSDNTIGGVAATHALVVRMQQAARAGGNPPLLIMTDQEGGEVRRLPGAPTMNADQITSTAMARREGIQTGRLLRSAGVNLDLAPVADVEAATDSFLGPRSFGTVATSVGQRACAFAAGLASQGVGYTLKHFPGLGLARTSTDLGPVTLKASSATLEAAWDAYHRCGANRMAMIMVSNAIYPNLTGPLPAVESPETYSRALPEAVGQRHRVTISDDLEAGALTKQQSPALHALNAGLDLAMYAGAEDGSELAFTQLIADARAGLLSRKRITAAEQSVVTFKRAVAG